jgi:hypothetical protein
MAESNAGRSIFISYRRADSEGESGRLFDDLTRAYGDASVFMDVSGIEPGADFRKAIDANVSGCGVLLAVIGPAWATVTAADGSRRLDNPDDYVRLEIATALARGIPVIPVLVHEAHMPALDLLPEDLKDLRYRNSVELTHARWNSDVTLLIAALKNYVAAVQTNPEQTVHATVSVQLPAPQPSPDYAADKPPKSKLPLYVMGGVGLAIAIGAAIFAAVHKSGGSAAELVPTTATQAASQAAPAAATQGAAATGAGVSGAGVLGKWRAQGQVLVDYPSQIEVTQMGGETFVHALANCPKKPDGFCNWGDRKVTVSGATQETAAWDPRNNPWEKDHQRQVSLILNPSATGLAITVHNRWQEDKGTARESLVPMQFVRMT